MFFIIPSLAVLAVYVLAAVVPAVFLMRYIYRADTVEKEPPGLLITLLLAGVAAALVSIVLETVGQGLLDAFAPDQGSPAYIIVFAFLVVAVVEEGTKFLFLWLLTWRNRNFNFRFDGVVYAVFVSLGFAAYENIRYVFSYGLSVAVPRALLAIPGHMGFAVFMGLFYGRARLCANLGETGLKNQNLLAGYIMAVFLHGFYDSCAMIGSTVSTILFVAFVVIMYAVVIRAVKRESRSNGPI